MTKEELAELLYNKLGDDGTNLANYVDKVPDIRNVLLDGTFDLVGVADGVLSHLEGEKKVSVPAKGMVS